MLFQECKLRFEHYVPDVLKTGMYFLITIGHELQIMKLDRVPKDEEQFIKEYGYPVEISIFVPGDPNIPDSDQICAYPEQIGWFDEGEFSEDIEDIDVKHINRIMSGYDGWCQIEMFEGEDEEFYPTIYEGKVTISYPDSYDDDSWDDDIDNVPEEEYKNDLYERDN